MRMRDELEQKVGLRFSKGLLAATNQEIYQALLELTQEKLAAARPITGRTHQLRVHFAHIGCPLAGDELYGGSRARIGRQALHCARMTFESPGAEGVQTVDCPLPPDMAALCEIMTKL